MSDGDTIQDDVAATVLEPDASAIAIAEWLEAGCLRPMECSGMDTRTYLMVAKLIREDWWRR